MSEATESKSHEVERHPSDPATARVECYHGLSGTPGQGHFFRLELRVINGTVSTVSYKTTDCIWATMIGMVLGGLIERKSIRHLESITETMVTSQVPDLPASNLTYISHAIAALRQALQSGPSLAPAVRHD